MPDIKKEISNLYKYKIDNGVYAILHDSINEDKFEIKGIVKKRRMLFVENKKNKIEIVKNYIIKIEKQGKVTTSCFVDFLEEELYVKDEN